jgi:hypothetical protein
LAEFQPIPVDRQPPRSWLSTLGSVAAVVLALAVIKPWGDPGSPAPTAGATAGRSARPAATVRAERTEYDPRLFGIREPEPAWELWPAGYVVEFGIAGPLRVGGQDEPSGSEGPAASEGAHATGAPSPGPGAASGPPPPAASEDPAAALVVDLGPADHLVALGINTPLDVRVAEISLWMQQGQACCSQPVPIIRLPTLWDSRHFLVIGIEDPERPGDTGPWPPAEYRLDLETTGGETRSVRLRVSPPVD